MSRARLITAAMGLLLSCSTAAGVAAARPAQDARDSGAPMRFVPGQVIVEYDSHTGRGARASLRSEEDLSLDERLPLPGVELLDVGNGTTVAEAVTGLKRHPEVRFAEPNYVDQPLATTPNDQYYPSQWPLNNTGQAPFNGVPDADIDAPEAWDVTTGNAAVTVAIADGGVVFSHPDLAANFRSTGYDFIDEDTDPSAESGETSPGHATGVAGVIGAVGNNGYAVAGVAWNVGLEPIRVCGTSGCPHADLIKAIIYARNQGVRIFNGSLGGTFFDQVEKDAIDQSPNTLFVFAAGNSGTDDDQAGVYPCAYSSANVICVAASDEFDQLWSGSNYGATTVDLAAPGVDILTTNADYNFNPIRSGTGTSDAAPAVAGAAALLLSVSPSATPAQLKAAILGGVDPLPSSAGKTVTGGRLNIDHLMFHPPAPPAPQAPGRETTAPQTKLSKHPGTLTAAHVASFAFRSNEAGSTFECRHDRGSFRPCKSPRTLKNLKPGPHHFRVRATDRAGNTDPSPAGFNWRIKKP